MSNFAWWCLSLSFTYSYHIQWSWSYLKVTALSNSFNWKFCAHVEFCWNFVGFLIMSNRSWICMYHILNCTHFHREAIDIYSHLNKKHFNVGFFLHMVWSNIWEVEKFYRHWNCVKCHTLHDDDTTHSA